MSNVFNKGFNKAFVIDDSDDDEPIRERKPDTNATTSSTATGTSTGTATATATGTTATATTRSTSSTADTPTQSVFRMENPKDPKKFDMKEKDFPTLSSVSTKSSVPATNCWAKKSIVREECDTGVIVSVIMPPAFKKTNKVQNTLKKEKYEYDEDEEWDESDEEDYELNEDICEKTTYKKNLW